MAPCDLYKMPHEDRTKMTLGAFRHWKGVSVSLPTREVTWWADCLTRSEIDPDSTHAMFIASNQTARLRCHGCRP